MSARLGRLPSYVSQRFRASDRISIEFCLRAPKGAATKVVGLEPGGISLVLGRGTLALRVAGATRLYHATQRVDLTGPATAVRLAISGGGSTVTLYVSGRKQDAFAHKAPSPQVVQVGSVAPSPGSSASRPGTTSSAGGSLTLTGVTVTSGSQPVIPVATNAPTSSAGSDQSGGAVPWPGNPFSPTSFWNAPLAGLAPIDTNSGAYVSELLRQIKGYGLWMNTTEYSTPVYVVAAGQSPQHVTLDTWGPDLQAQFDAVPIPANALAAAGTDQHMVVWQPSTDKMWEFWLMHKAADGWHARWGGEIDNVSSSPGYFTHSGQTKSWGATATGLPLLGGLVTRADLQRGYINHALAISLVEAARGNWSWPAQRTDGWTFTSGIAAIPEGTRFRLDPTLNVDSLKGPTILRMLAKAAQTYGIVVRDKAGSVALYGEDPKSLTGNPWAAAFSNQYPNNVLAQFPWDRLEALQTQQSCCWGP